MLLVDDRIGSRDLLIPLQRFGVPAMEMRLDYADFAFIGRGVGGEDLQIGIELKETADLILSLQQKRLAGHQLEGLVRTYDRCWLLTEGIWKVDDGGLLQVFERGWHYPRIRSNGRTIELRQSARDLYKEILTVTVRGGLHQWHTGTRADTIHWLSVLYHWWTDKSLDQHKSHLAFHTPDLDRALLTPPSLCRQFASRLPGIGWEKSRAVEEHFAGSIRAMVHSSLQDWTQIPGVGKTIASRAIKALE